MPLPLPSSPLLMHSPTSQQTLPLGSTDGAPANHTATHWGAAPTGAAPVGAPSSLDAVNGIYGMFMAPGAGSGQQCWQ